MKRGTGDVHEELGNKNDEQVAVRHADASGSYIIENQHEEKIMRGIRVDKKRIRGNERRTIGRVEEDTTT